MKLPLNQELSLRFDSLFQWLNRKYQLELVEQEIAGYTYQIYKIADIDAVLDEVIAKSSSPDSNTPYWTELWPSAIALGEFLRDKDWSGKTVLGLGSGVGAAEMVARQQGANVIISDNKEDALRLAELNWIINFNESPQLLKLDWFQPNITGQFEILLASDVAYERRLFYPLIDTFLKLLKPDGEIYLSEPNRKIAEEFFDLLDKQGFEFERHSKRIFYKGRETNISIYRILQKE